MNYDKLSGTVEEAREPVGIILSCKGAAVCWNKSDQVY